MAVISGFSGSCTNSLFSAGKIINDTIIINYISLKTLKLHFFVFETKLSSKH